jgi:hypothetical protein
MARTDTNPIPDESAAATLGLQAVAWLLAEDDRARRLVDVTGIAPADLRGRLGDPAVLAAALAFLEAHEPDLIACADALDVPVDALVRARAMLETMP